MSGFIGISTIFGDFSGEKQAIVRVSLELSGIILYPKEKLLIVTEEE